MIPIIVLDPGHGGSAPGSINEDLVESFWNLEMANLVKHSLWAATRNVIFTRETALDEQCLSLQARGEIAKDNAAALVVSIHVNSLADKTQKGAFVFHWPGNSLGRIIANEIVASLPLNLREQDDVGFLHTTVQAATKSWGNVREVLRHHPANCVSILIECGFGSNKEDREYLTSYWGKRRVAHAIASGILYFCEQFDGTKEK